MKRIDALCAIERTINGRDAAERLRVRQEHSAPLVAEVAQPIDDMMRRWEHFTGFFDDGRICLTNNARSAPSEVLLSVARLGSSPAPSAGANRAAAMATLINTAKLNDVDPQAWLSRTLPRAISF
ncbi:hypothetical protein GGR04_004691 [Aureimonas pseudogalii]|uniref:Transposase IS66 central domain-containing protein n=1 Tax=Aureimonas pseudogalii TaxID=1744844 RepID=A0A7W6MMG0_9HYPH|nr:hypothetical protein [Aureimonas pseudogalii]